MPPPRGSSPRSRRRGSRPRRSRSPGGRRNPELRRGRAGPLARPTATTRPSSTSTSPGTISPAHQGGFDPEPHWPRRLPNRAFRGLEPRAGVLRIDAGQQRDERDPRVAGRGLQRLVHRSPPTRRWRSRRCAGHVRGASRSPARLRPSGRRTCGRAGSSSRSRSCSGRASARYRPSAASSLRAPRARPRPPLRARPERAARLSRALVTATPRAPAPRATSSAASTNGVAPLALTATTQSSGRRVSPRQCVRRRRTIVLVRVLVGDDGEDLAGWRAERGAALGRVERGQGSRRAGAGVDEPAAALHALDDRVDRSGERVSCLGDRARNRGVLVVEEPHEVARRAEVEVGEIRARSFGRRGLRPTRERRTHRVPDERRVGRRERASCGRRPRTPTSRGRRRLPRALPRSQLRDRGCPRA